MALAPLSVGLDYAFGFPCIDCSESKQAISYPRLLAHQQLEE